MNWFKKQYYELIDFFSDEENPDEPICDPVHVAILIISVLFTIGIVFWLLWSLLVYEGGLAKKVVPAFQVLFTQKTLEDFGWVGYPFELGIFQGFITNIVALILTCVALIGIWWLFQPIGKSKNGEDKHDPSN